MDSKTEWKTRIQERIAQGMHDLCEQEYREKRRQPCQHLTHFTRGVEMMQDPYFRYYVIDFEEPQSQPELIRISNRSYAFRTLQDWASLNGYRLIDMGPSKPSGAMIQSVIKFGIRDGDFR